MLMGKLEEFPSLKSPSGNEANPFRRRKRKLILYSLYLFSIIVMCRLANTFYWLYTLDLNKLCLNKVVYDTKTWKKIEVGISLENSESPIHVKFTDVTANLFSMSTDGIESPLLSLRIPGANIAKHKNILFNGDIYVENFNRRNMLESRFSVNFVIKIDAKMYPRLCFIRFPFHSSQTLSLGSSISRPGKEVVFKHVCAGMKDGYLLLEGEVDSSKFNVPKFVVIRSREIVVNFGGGEGPRTLTIGPIEVDGTMFMEPLIVKISISEEWGDELRRSLVRVLRGDEVCVKVDDFYFKNHDDGTPEERIRLGIGIGFNAKNSKDYDITFMKKNVKSTPLSAPVIILRNVVGRENPGLNIYINKDALPCIEYYSFLAIPSKPVSGSVHLNGCCIGGIEVEVGNTDKHFVLLCTFLEFDSLKILKAFKMRRKKDLRVVLNSDVGFGVLVNNVGVAWDLSENLYLFYKDERYDFLSSEKNKDSINVRHVISNASGSLRVDTAVVFSPIRKNSVGFLQLNLHGFSLSLANAGINARINVSDTNILYQNTNEPFCRRLFGKLTVHTRVEDTLDCILRSIEYVGDDPVEDDEQQGLQLGKICLRYDDGKPNELGKHFFSITIPEDSRSRDMGASIQNIVRVVGGIRFSLVADTRDMSFGPVHPVVVEIGNSKLRYLKRGKEACLDVIGGIDVSVSFSHPYDLVALWMCDVDVVCDEKDYMARTIKSIVAKAMRKRDGRAVEKHVCNKDLVFKSRLKKMKSCSPRFEHVYEGVTEISIPIEMFNSAGIEFDIPRVGVAAFDVCNENSHYRGIASVETLPCSYYEFEGSEYRSFGILYRFSELSLDNALVSICLINGNKLSSPTVIEHTLFRKIMADIRNEFTKVKGKSTLAAEISSTSNWKIRSIGKTVTSDEDTWTLRVFSDKLKDLVFSKVPNLLLDSFYEVLPSGMRFVVDIDKDVVEILIESHKRNPWRDEEAGSESKGPFYGILDLKFSRFLFSETVKYKFQTVEDIQTNKNRAMLERPYRDPFTDTAEYKDWCITSKFGFQANITNDGVICIPKVRFSMPIVFSLVSIFPPYVPFVPDMNGLGMYVEFPLPFDLRIPSPELPVEVTFVSKSNDKELGRLGFGTIVSSPNIFFITISIPPTSYALSLGETLKRYKKGRKRDYPTIQQDVSISIFVNGVKAHECLNRIVVEAQEFSGLLHSLVFLEKRLFSFTGTIARKIQRSLRESKKKQPRALGNQ
ncbi:hypothetical protein EHEL_010870 [Encephalitozoon hellem ATCC 50504]|uniref:Uncharacterized protein n=1 Tax=Encephalitozoon hellem TaxID=27973 RepID=A0A9Q9C4I6_ENCHE|nr:uncharacterized protein EHEL_010870 [Encephalitozoon hellem ATCC 50504]AFM97710.1 hypothetical protein EHEL_010870 [Encephalitozoon hellem ATCC 50504]UTX42402.1 hypothetical protein GPU96_01g01050 [Encephalitozoon hellem]|eukprot:XP_003886691.1 hypothetical protein EHEL_010870 [Encephalitozoon hellem ATCC 50504]